LRKSSNSTFISSRSVFAILVTACPLLNIRNTIRVRAISAIIIVHSNLLYADLLILIPNSISESLFLTASSILVFRVAICLLRFVISDSSSILEFVSVFISALALTRESIEFLRIIWKISSLIAL